MLLEQTMERLNAMKLFGMAKAFREWNDAPKRQEVSLADFIGFLADGDTVIFRGHCGAPGRVRIGFGECRGTVLPARG